jgi:predicted Zn-dependent protease
MSRPFSLFADPRVLSREEARAITQSVLAAATGTETRVTVDSIARGNSRFAVNQISTSGDNFDVVVTVRSSIDERSGSATTNDLSPASLKRVVETAERLARLSPRDAEYMPELTPQAYGPGLGWAEPTAAMEPGARAAAVAKVTTPAAAANLVSTGYMEARASAQAVANSKGLFAYNRHTESVLTTTVRTPDGRGSGWAGAASNDWSQIDPAALGARAIDKAQRSVDAVAVEPGRYTTILEPTAVGNLVQLIVGAATARSADEGRSFFSTPGGGNKIGMKVVDERVTLVSDPFATDSFDSPFFGDGFPARRIAWIENGVVKNLAYDRYWAKKQGKQPNVGGGGGGGFGGGGGGGGGGVPGGIKMTGGTATLDDLIRSTERGILVTRFWYIRAVDPRTILYTGLTRDGTFLIENGRITRPVKNLRFNESPIFMLNNLEAMTAAVRVSATEGGNPGRPVIVPAIKVRDFAFTSGSDAI